jgi:hypothetical protein
MMIGTTKELKDVVELLKTAGFLKVKVASATDPEVEYSTV